jgi:3-methylfumaryl-CoA hydratase
MPAVDIKALQDRVGDEAVRDDVLDPRPLAQLALTLDMPGPAPVIGDPLPAGRHWLYFNSIVPQAELRADGNASAPPPLPPIDLPRRMWGGGRIDFHRPLRVGSKVRRRTTVHSIYERAGKAGPLVFVVLRHEISDEHGIALVEEQEMLHRDPALTPRGAVGRTEAPPDAAEWTMSFRPSVSQLFRYSAATFNAHRIHYDADFARHEGYGGAVVHGPLLAMLLMDGTARHSGRIVRRLSYRGVSPLFHDATAVLAGRIDGDQAQAWAATAAGNLGLTATIDLK